MDREYAFIPDIWLLIACIVLLFALMLYGWRRRAVPGAWLFAAACLYTALWSGGTALDLLARGMWAKVIWATFAIGWQIPAITALLCFALQFAGLERWLSRRVLLGLSAPPFLFLGLALTDPWHHLLWAGFAPIDGYVRLLRGPAGWLLVGYSSLLYLASFAVLTWLFIHAPRRRGPAALIFCGQLAGGAAFVIDPIVNVERGPFSPLAFGVAVAAVLYAFALFRFRILEPVAEARALVVEQMDDGMLVLDTEQAIADLNPAMQKILGVSPAGIRGRKAFEVLPASPCLTAALETPGVTGCDVTVGRGLDARHYDLHLLRLQNEAGMASGRLIVFHDVTEEKRVHAQLVEQQRIMATLHERERLARELHDSAGQVLGYVSMQAQAIAKRLQDGDIWGAETLLARLAEVAQDAHRDVRESIFGLKAVPAGEWSFLTNLEQHLESFGRNYGIETELVIPTGSGDQVFEPGTAVQLLRVIQEALSNARRHGRAHHIQVSIARRDNLAQVVVSDDGCGFDPEEPGSSEGGQFGLAAMRERMAQVAGRVTIDSSPGAGTRVVLDLPWRTTAEEAP